MSHFYPMRTKPFKGVSAFARISEDTTPSQAAVLLSFGNQIRGGDAPLRARAAARKRQAVVAGEPEADFPVPRLKGVQGPVPLEESRARLLRMHAYKARAAAAPTADFVRYEAVCHDAAARVFDKPLVTHAADLFALCLEHPRELVRIAAAIASLPLTTQPQQNLRVLVGGLKSADELERALAATGLARTYPDHPALKRLSRGKTPAPPAKRRRQTVLLVHGTWASDAAWYQPGGDFFQFIEARRPDLYGAPDFFRWSGGWSDGARLTGATQLKQWVESRNESGLDLIGHSHGANVMLEATKQGLQVGKAVLLSCPAHVDKYFPNFAKIAQLPVRSVRVHLDLVILADGGAQRFRHPDIQETVLPIWFDHGATHDPQVWQAHNVAQKIGL